MEAGFRSLLAESLELFGQDSVNVGAFMVSLFLKAWIRRMTVYDELDELEIAALCQLMSAIMLHLSGRTDLASRALPPLAHPPSRENSVLNLGSVSAAINTEAAKC